MIITNNVIDRAVAGARLFDLVAAAGRYFP
jgi:hypothetical protein